MYRYYADGKGKNFKSYEAAAASGILSIGVHVYAFGNNQKQAAIQSGLIRLGKVIGNIDGQIGRNTHRALDELGAFSFALAVENLVQNKFANEFRMPVV